MTKSTSQLLRSVASLAVAGVVAFGTTQSFAQGGGSGGASSGSGSFGQGAATSPRQPDGTQEQPGTPPATSPGRRGEAPPAQDRDRNRSDSRQGQQDHRDGERSGNAQNRDQGRDGDSQRTQDQDRSQSRGSSRESRDQDRGGKTDAQGSAELQGEQRTRVREVITRQGHRMERTQVNINLSVGRALPARVTVRPLPAAVIEIVPQYRGYDYIYVGDEIYIIQPRTRRVVYVIDANDVSGSRGPSGAVGLASLQQERPLAR